MLSIANISSMNKNLTDTIENLDMNDIINAKHKYSDKDMKLFFIITTDKKKVDPLFVKLTQDVFTITDKNHTDEINNVISDESDNKIRTFINGINEDAFIGNVIYLNIKWKVGFNNKDTFLSDFYGSGKIEMMHQINYYNYYENNEIQIVEVPFGNSDNVMGILLPKKNIYGTEMDYSINNVPFIEQNQLNEYINNMRYVKINLFLPKLLLIKKSIILIH